MTELGKHITRLMEREHTPGLAMALIKDQDILCTDGFGVTSVEDGALPITPRTLFRIGSTTKLLTGIAIMRLVEAGSLDLDTPITKYLDWLTFSEVGVVEQVTLRMLLSHTSGLPAYGQFIGAHDVDGLERYVREEIPRYRLAAAPGQRFVYSNPGLSLAGYLAQCVSSKPYPGLMQELVFHPLRMERTTFDPTVAMAYPLAQSHDWNPEDGTLSVQHRFADNTAHYPAGFAFLTVLDLANVALMLLNQGRFQESQLLSPQFVQMMQTPQIMPDWANGKGYGLTHIIDTYNGMRRVGHNGGISTFGSRFDLFPDAGMALILLYNRLSLDEQELVNSIFPFLEQ